MGQKKPRYRGQDDTGGKLAGVETGELLYSATLDEKGRVVKGEGGSAGGGAERPPGAPSPFPCLNSPNSNKTCPEEGPESPSVTCRRDRDGRELITGKIGGETVSVWLGGMSQREKKGAFALTENLAHLAAVYGVEKLGFLTLGFRENLTDFREAQRRFNSLSFRVIRPMFRHWVVTVEPQKRGAVHYHLVVVCREDIRTGIDFAAIAERDYRSASPYLRGLWDRLRQAMPAYGFGRSELLPVRSTAEGISKYVGKYLEKGSLFRGDQFRGARMVRYSRSGWRAVSTEFAWATPGAREWRRYLGQVTALLGCESMEEMTDSFGRYWAFKLLTMRKVDPDISAAQAAQILGQTAAIKEGNRVYELPGRVATFDREGAEIDITVLENDTEPAE